jgi:DNA-binding IclR family transcriptional regulator
MRGRLGRLSSAQADDEGGTLPAHATPMGKGVVAELPEDARTDWIDSQDYVVPTPQTISDADGIRKVIDLCAERGSSSMTRSRTWA